MGPSKNPIAWPVSSPSRISFLTYPPHQVLENPGGPEEDIVFPDPVAHGGHAGGFFFGRVLQSLIDVVSDLLRIKGVDAICPAQFSGRAGKGAEEQRAVAVHPAGDVFLGNQIHAVVEGADHHDIRQAVIGDDLFLGKVGSRGGNFQTAASVCRLPPEPG